ncbi:uncharacterized protein TRAVEDRAFT_59459 [Trametes versicolor FP-101664 SS1]|uniref:uncharacterized protein n=1 Tax=Trametes versicolor (strain FP-101664) TaxID=717944 RepID=UPI0004621C7F|nr:uncharacterized protein TRAVEDRAFT_59459 [Trametes versicolor FP-101664 SS1]EIW58042.1 hypothetical protein TRAVEDRAFT_59459 [Trametes versicolor FP-101664 SS1]
MCVTVQCGTSPRWYRICVNLHTADGAAAVYMKLRRFPVTTSSPSTSASAYGNWAASLTQKSKPLRTRPHGQAHLPSHRIREVRTDASAIVDRLDIRAATSPILP